MQKITKNLNFTSGSCNLQLPPLLNLPMLNFSIFFKTPPCNLQFPKVRFEIKREGSIQGEEGLYKKLKIPTLPPKSLF